MMCDFSTLLRREMSGAVPMLVIFFEKSGIFEANPPPSLPHSPAWFRSQL